MKIKVNPNDYENQEELVSCAAEDLRDALRLEDLEEAVRVYQSGEAPAGVVAQKGLHEARLRAREMCIR